ncbi:A24 family peptidase [Maricaulis sp. CAU 1757]
MWVQLLILVFAGLVLFAAWCDAVSFTIPNWLSGAVALAFLPAALVAGLGWGEAGNHLLGGGVALLIGFALFAPGWIGGGDAKLFAAAALWMGWPDMYQFLMATVLAGGVLVLALIVLRRGLAWVPQVAGRLDGSALAKDAPVPYGIAIAAGALWSIPGSLVFASI